MQNNNMKCLYIQKKCRDDVKMRKTGAGCHCDDVSTVLKSHIFLVYCHQTTLSAVTMQGICLFDRFQNNHHGNMHQSIAVLSSSFPIFF